jgi:MFS family permease
MLAIWTADYRLVFWVSIAPGVVAVALVLWFIEADRPASTMAAAFSWHLRSFDARFLGFIMVVGLFSLGNSSNAFLLLKAAHVGMSPAWISGCYLVFNAVYAVVSIPGGILADRFGKRRMIGGGFGLFSAVYAGFALATTIWQIAGLFVLYGIYMGLTEGVQRAYLATLVPAQRQATGFGLYHMVVGVAILPASLIAGLLWDSIGPSAPFWFGAGTAALAGVLFVGISWKHL